MGEVFSLVLATLRWISAGWRATDAYFRRRAGRPYVRVQATTSVGRTLESGKWIPRHALAVIARNSDEARIQITKAMIEDLDRGGGVYVGEGLLHEDSPERELPVTLKEYHEAVWELDLQALRRGLSRQEIRRDGKTLLFRGNVKVVLFLGNGKNVKSKRLKIGTEADPTTWALGDPERPPRGQ